MTEMKSNYIAEIKARVAGIPCIIGVTYFDNVIGSYSYHAASDLDYHGYTDIEFDLLDRKGRLAPWLERKLDNIERERIEQLIYDHMVGN